MILTAAILCLSITILMFWWFFAIEITYRERLWIIGRLYHDGSGRPANWSELARLFDEVSQWQHLWRTLTFRRPWSIYPDKLRTHIAENNEIWMNYPAIRWLGTILALPFLVWHCVKWVVRRGWRPYGR